MTRYQDLFFELPVAVWDEDFSAVKTLLDDVLQGCADPAEYLENHPDIVRQCASMVRVNEVSNRVLEIYGATNRQDLLSNLDQVFTEESFTTFTEELCQFATGNYQFRGQAPNLTLDGRTIQIELRAVIPEKYRQNWKKIIVTTEDISHKYHMEQNLRQSEERFRDFYQASPLPYQSLDAAGRLLDVNPAYEEMLGYSRAELIGTKVSRLLTPESRELLQQRFCTFLETGKVREAEFTMRRKDGTLVEVVVNGNASYDSNGRFVQTHCLLTDISSQKATRDELVKRERSYRQLYEQFRTLFDGIPDVLLLLTPDARLSWANQSMTTACGVPVENLIGKDCSQLFHDHAIPCDAAATRRCIDNGEIETSLITTPDGRNWGIRAFPIRTENGSVSQVMELAHDVTEKITLQAETMRTGHLAALGELAAGVAHEINNPINGIINYAQILINKAAKAGEQNSIAERIVKEGDRIATIVGNLLSFSRDRVEEKRPVVLVDLLEEALSLCAARLRKDGIRIELDLPPELPCLHGKHQKLEQVFINLISNAQHAINQRFPTPCEDKSLKISARHQGSEEMMTIIFHDNGCGIPENLQDRILNPFFSTKPQGEGTGLGLSISHGIIQDHGGSIHFDSMPGEYTKVILKLPVTTKEAYDETNSLH